MGRKLLKIVIIGDSGVGKTSCLIRYIKKEFKEEGYSSTIGADFMALEEQINDQQVMLQIWDSCGQERFQGLSNAFFRGADGYVLVCAVNNENSFQSLKEWKTSFIEAAGVDAPYVLLANKTDVNKEEVLVTEEDIKKWCQTDGLYTNGNACPFFLGSAKKAVGVKKCLDYLAEIVLENMNQETNKEEYNDTIKVSEQTQEKTDECKC